MTPDLSALPETTAILVNVVLLLGVLIASVKGWFSAKAASSRPAPKASEPRDDRVVMEIIATVLADRSATANLATAARDLARSVSEIAQSLDRIERKLISSA